MFVGTKIGPFAVEKELGSGAMGTVYKARYEAEGKARDVAIKIIALGLLGNDGAMARFEREANILKQLRHPHIVRLFATGKHKSTPFIAMEFVDGEPMDRILVRRGKLGWEDVITLGKQLCDALQYAHDKGIIHRDLKPSNLMVGRDGVLKLTDFGIAKDTDVTSLTGMNSTIGTAAYMSPEQCKGDRNLTNKSDLYSLGVVFYELVTGKKPFTSDATVDMFLKHVNEKPVRPSRFTADLPVWLDNLIMFLLEKERDRRPLDAATVKRLLEEIEEKVMNQKSAAEDIANARRIDRPLGDKELDDADIAAARSLKGGPAPAKGPRKKKKARKDAAPPTWLKMLPVAGLLAAVVGIGIYFVTTSKGGDAGPAADLNEAKGKDLEAVLIKRFKTQTTFPTFRTAQDKEDPDTYDAAWRAMELEQKGELPQAAALWTKVAAANPPDKYGDGWAWLGKKRGAEITGLDDLLKKQKDEAAKLAANELEWKLDPQKPESLAVLAVRFAGVPRRSADPTRPPLPAVQDPQKARKAWAALADWAKDKPEHRAWLLLAGRERERIAEQKADAALPDRLKMVQGVLSAAEAEWLRVKTLPDLLAEWKECRVRCRDLVELYGDDGDDAVKAFADKARALLTTIQKAKPAN